MELFTEVQEPYKITGKAAYEALGIAMENEKIVSDGALYVAQNYFWESAGYYFGKYTLEVRIMKIRVLSIIFTMAIFCFGACAVQREAEKEEAGFKNDSAEQGKTEQSNKLPVEIQDRYCINDYFTIIEKTYEQKGNGFDIEIFYPELQGMEDAEKEERINQLIEVEAQRLIPEESDIPNEWIDDGYVICVFLDYEIKFLNNNIISILYTGMDGCIVKGLDGAVMATTIDLQTEEVVKLSDIVTDMEQVHSLLLADRFQSITLWEGTAGNNLISEEYKDEREVWLMDALNGISKEHSFIEWYTDGMNLIIVSESPYGMDDYNEYAASLKSLQGIITQKFIKKLHEVAL